MSVAAIIFDLDGTVLDNEKQYGQAFSKVLEDLGAKVDEEYPHTAGIGVKENWPLLLDKYGLSTDKSHEELEQETREEYKKNIKEIELKEGFEDFIKEARSEGYMTALATSNVWSAVEQIFDLFNIEYLFDVITTSEEVEEKKPNPSIFLVTAQKLGLSPKECLVFEDAESGVAAAVSANMSVIGVARDKEYEKKLKKADMIIHDFTDISVETILNL